MVLALLAEGCFTGHLLDAARRLERPVAYHDASIDGDRLFLAYTALVTDDLGYPLARAERRAAVALADLRRSGLPVERFPVTRLPDGAVLGGRRVVLTTTHERDLAPRSFIEIEDGGDGRPMRLVLHDEAEEFTPLYSGALARRRTAAWAYPLVPFAIAIDAVTEPVLFFFAPAVILLGD